MIFVYPEITGIFDTDNPFINTIVIESQSLFVRLLTDITEQLSGRNGKSVISINGKELPFDKNAELLSQFVPFELNKKSLITKINSAIEKEAMLDLNYPRTMELIGGVEAYLLDITSGFNCDLSFGNLSIGSIVKASGAIISEYYDSLAEKIIDYFELVTEFDRTKLFILVNSRDYISDEEMELFAQTVISHHYSVLMIESHEHQRFLSEKRLIIDKDLCEIM